MKPTIQKGQVKLSLSKKVVSRLSEANMGALNTGAAATGPTGDGDPLRTIFGCGASVMACSAHQTCIYCDGVTG
jgi:hypothetical protein